MIRTILPAISWSVFVLFLSLIPGNEIPEFQVEYLHVDKIAHAILFAGLSFFWIFGILKSQVQKILGLSSEFFVSISVFLFGILIEIIQHYWIIERQFDVFDIAANGIGILLGFSFFYLVIYKRI